MAPAPIITIFIIASFSVHSLSKSVQFGQQIEPFLANYEDKN
jgi:hypothetical protein